MMTVCSVLRGGSGYADDARARVPAMAHHLGYVPNKLAVAFTSDSATAFVGICVPRLSSGLFGDVPDGVDRALNRLAYAQARGIRVPEDLGIVGWGGMETASVLPKRQSPTIVPTTTIGKLAAEALVARLKGQPGSDLVVVPTRLVPGEKA